MRALAPVPVVLPEFDWFNALRDRVLGVPLAKRYAFAALPVAETGQLATVTDSNTVVWGAVIAGGGANAVLAFYNGVAWTVAGR